MDKKDITPEYLNNNLEVTKEYRCPKCHSEDIQSFKMVVATNTSKPKINSAKKDANKENASETTQASIVSQLPPLPNPKDFHQSEKYNLNYSVGISMACVFGFLTYYLASSTVEAFTDFNILGLLMYGLGTIIFALLSFITIIALFEHNPKNEKEKALQKQIYERKVDSWNNSYICFRCGNTFIVRDKEPEPIDIPNNDTEPVSPKPVDESNSTNSPVTTPAKSSNEKENKINRRTIIAIIAAAFLLVIVFTSGLAYFLSDKNSAQTTPTAQIAEETKTETPSQSNVRDDISVSIYVPTKFDNKSDAPYYIVLKNISDKTYEGSFELDGVSTTKASDKIGTLKLYPEQVKLIAGTGSIPKDTSSINLKTNGKFSGKNYNRDSSLDYSIVKQEEKGVMTILHVYMPTGISDDTYIAASKEIQQNMSGINKIVVANFSPIMINPTFEQVWVRMRNNKIMNKNDILFYTDESNTRIFNPQTYAERRDIDL